VNNSRKKSKEYFEVFVKGFAEKTGDGRETFSQDVDKNIIASAAQFPVEEVALIVYLKQETRLRIDCFDEMGNSFES
jgi:hypothetical protein